MQEVKLSANGKEYGKNTLVYGANGRLTELYPSEGCRYNIEYDGFGKATKFSLNGVTLLTKEYNAAKNWVEARYHRSENEVDRLRTQYDRYGRVKELTNNGSPLLETEYEDEAGGFAESPSCANIKSMTDHCTGETYTYDYDEYTGRPTKYAVKNDEVDLQVICAGSNKIKYEFNDWVLNYEDEVTYDEDCLISPRVTKAYNNNDLGMDWNLSYDKLGRYSGREEAFNILMVTSPKMTIGYKEGTFLKERIEYDRFGRNETIGQTYDERGNISTVTDEYNFGEFEGKDTAVYTYDDVNRLVHEEVSGACAFTRSYQYDEEGNISKVVSDGAIETYTYDCGRLTKISAGGTVKEIAYDQYGNPTKYKSGTQNMWWERGTFLKKYGEIEYTYDGQGKLYKKTKGERRWLNYYDEDKLIAQKIGENKIRYFYDIEGVVGFKIGPEDKYTYAKDGQGNVVGLFYKNDIVAKYVYDAWGNCKVLDKNGNEITEEDHPAVLNPIRWKSRYYDVDSGLYWIGQRWYDPETGRYVNAASPEMLLENASVVFALNLYALCTGNPVALVFASSTFLPTLDFYYDGEYKTWWEENGWLVMLIAGGAIAAIACALAVPTCGASLATVMGAIGTTLANIALETAIGAAISLAIGGTIAGIQAALTGHGFWQAFEDSVTENFVDAVVTSFAVAAITVAVGNFITRKHCFKEGTLVETEDGLKPIEEIEVGDKVLAYDEETGEQAYKPVVQLFRNTTEEWYHVRVNEEEIVCTGGHSFYVLNAEESRNSVLYEGTKTDTKGKWITAKALKVSDKVLLSDGSCGIIEEIQFEQLETLETTYNFEVADFHTYYVSDSKVLVHNMCRSQNPKAPEKLNFDKKQVGKKWGKHKFDYPELNSYDDYMKLAEKVFNNAESIEYVMTGSGAEFRYLLGNNLLRVNLSGSFISLYPV